MYPRWNRMPPEVHIPELMEPSSLVFPGSGISGRRPSHISTVWQPRRTHRNAVPFLFILLFVESKVSVQYSWQIPNRKNIIISYMLLFYFSTGEGRDIESHAAISKSHGTCKEFEIVFLSNCVSTKWWSNEGESAGLWKWQLQVNITLFKIATLDCIVCSLFYVGTKVVSNFSSRFLLEKSLEKSITLMGSKNRELLSKVRQGHSPWTSAKSCHIHCCSVFSSDVPRLSFISILYDLSISPSSL